MKSYIKIFFLSLIFSGVILGGEKKVLVEIFTNSHCPACPPAHQALDNYLQTENGKKIIYVYYHIQFPYSTDKLYQHNTTDSQAKNNLYGSYSSTPQSFFDGNHVSNSYSNWKNTLDNKVNQQSNFEIALSGTYTDNDFTVTASITKTSEVSVNDLIINFVVVEDLFYQGNNGISNHKNVMRAIPKINGEPFNIGVNETVNLSQTIARNNEWDINNLKIIAFVQSSSNKEVYQAEQIDYNSFTVTDVETDKTLKTKFTLEQNYPNPFNPTTTIEYSIPVGATHESPLQQHVQLKVYDILGKEVATLVNRKQQPGNYKIKFDASELSTGIYYYKIIYGKFTDVKKMILMK